MPESESALHILVVAPNTDLRRSLAFILAAEGYVVSEAVAWPPMEPGLDFDALVIDHAALDRKLKADAYLTALGDRAVILASRAEPFPALRQATVIRKPLLDGVLLETLRTRLSSRRVRRVP